MEFIRRIKRKIAQMLVLIMLMWCIAPSVTPKMGGTVYAAGYVDSVLLPVANKSLGKTVEASAVNDAAKAVHTSGTWSSVTVVSILNKLGGAANPVDYSGNAMSGGYTLGKLMVDYTRSKYTGAAMLTDEEIIGIFDMQAEGAGSANIDVDAFMAAVASAAASKGTGGFNANEGTSVIDTSNFITYGEYIQRLSSPVAAGTLYIGTWIIDAQAITSTFYEMAIDSMAQVNQNNKLYKSELSSGYWKNIEGAESLEAILPLADNVPETEMLNLYISVIVGRDGIPHSAKTGDVVDVFSMSNPYEMEQVPELRGVKALLDGKVVSASDTGSKNYTYWQLTRLFNYDQPYDRKLDYKTACDYVFDVSKRSNIAFYAKDARGTGRFEESGKGFINALEMEAENKGDRYIQYVWSSHNDTAEHPALIRGAVNWGGEKAWVDEVNKFPKGMDTLNERLMLFRRIWLHTTQVHDDISDDADSKMSALTNLYFSLCRSNNPEDKELAAEAMSVESALDSLRRYRAYYNMVENPENNTIVGPSLGFIYELVSTGTSSIGGDYKVCWHWYTSDDFEPVDSVVAAMEEALVSCTQAMYEYKSKSIQEGSTILSKTKYSLQMNVINNASGGPSAVSEDLRKLIDIDNISNNVIAHKSRELNLITDSLIPTADANFRSQLHSGLNDEGRAVVSDPASTDEIKNEVMKDQKAGISASAAELQLLIKARAMRLTKDRAIDFIKQRINIAESQRVGIRNDVFKVYANEALDAHITWLTELLNQVKSGSTLSEDDNSYDKKLSNIENDILTALDNGDIEGAERLEKQLSDLKDSQDADEKAKRDIINNPNASAADKAEALDTNTPTGIADKIANNAIQDISDGKYDGVSGDIDALDALGSDKLSNVLNALYAHGAPKSLINQAKDAIANNNSDFKDRYGTASKTADNDTSDASIKTEDASNENGIGEPITGEGTGLTEDLIASAIKDAFGKDFNKLSELDKAAVVAGLLNYAKARDDGDVYNYLIARLSDLLDQKNIFIYKQYLSDETKEYVSLAAINRCRRYSRFRLVEEKNEITMTQIVGGTASYLFKDGKTDVIINSKDEDIMNTPVVSQADSYLYGNNVKTYPYIVEDYGGKYMYCTGTYIPGTTWAILVTPQLDKKIANFLDELDEYVDGIVNNSNN